MKNTGRPLLLTGILAIVSVAVMIAALFSVDRTADFVPPPFDPAAQKGTPPASLSSDYRALDAQVFQAALCGQPRLLGSAVEVWLTNPEENSVWLKLRILDSEGNILGETGLLRPGEYVRQLQLDETYPPPMQLVLKLMAYEPETYHSAGSVTVRTSFAP